MTFEERLQIEERAKEEYRRFYTKFFEGIKEIDFIDYNDTFNMKYGAYNSELQKNGVDVVITFYDGDRLYIDNKPTLYYSNTDDIKIRIKYKNNRDGWGINDTLWTNMYCFYYMTHHIFYIASADSFHEYIRNNLDSLPDYQSESEGLYKIASATELMKQGIMIMCHMG